MKYNKEFIDLVNYAVERNKEFYSESKNMHEPNPYYIGYGNPKAKILLIGKEKGFDPNNLNQLKAESLDNVKQWKFLIDNDIDKASYLFSNELFNKDYAHFHNPLQPYHGDLQGKGQGQTWYYYNKLACLINNEPFKKDIAQLFSNTFITELNYRPSKISPGRNNLSDELKFRMQFLRENAFYQKFKVIILAFGNYIEEEQIKDIFGTNLEALAIEENLKSKQRLFAYKDNLNNRIIINTRQLSNQFPSSYLENIAKIIHQETHTQ